SAAGCTRRPCSAWHGAEKFHTTEWGSTTDIVRVNSTHGCSHSYTLLAKARLLQRRQSSERTLSRRLLCTENHANMAQMHGCSVFVTVNATGRTSRYVGEIADQERSA